VIADALAIASRLHAAAVRPRTAQPALFASLGHRGSALSEILRAHPFGQAPPQRQAPEAASANLHLTGVTVIDAATGYAIIRDAGSTSHLYSTGSIVSQDVTLAAVLADRVLLREDGKLTELRMERPSPRAAPSVQLAEADPGDDEHAASGRDADASVQRPVLEPRPLPTSGAILRTLNLLPVMQNGQRVGMRVAASSSAAASLAALGLDSGDVIVALNGAAASDGRPLSGQLMASINDGQDVTLAVERGGQLIDVTIDSEHAQSAAQIYRLSAQ
jgi:type II secretion system protein C